MEAMLGFNLLAEVPEQTISDASASRSRPAGHLNRTDSLGEFNFARRPALDAVLPTWTTRRNVRCSH